ncbi:MAG: OadG family protein [Deltaproteobacteria bacterium]|nr:OadG family protein [Deltaproteobacteria bacterium]
MADVDWPLAWSIVARGIGLVFGIMLLLAGITSILGRIMQRAEPRKKAAEGEAK